jgi:hypothetical protein
LRPPHLCATIAEAILESQDHVERETPILSIPTLGKPVLASVLAAVPALLISSSPAPVE